MNNSVENPNPNKKRNTGVEPKINVSTLDLDADYTKIFFIDPKKIPFPNDYNEEIKDQCTNIFSTRYNTTEPTLKK